MTIIGHDSPCAGCHHGVNTGIPGRGEYARTWVPFNVSGDPGVSTCSGNEFAGRPGRVSGVEPYDGQFRTVMGTIEGMSPSEGFSPAARQSGGFVHMSMERDERLPVFDEPSDGKTSDMNIKRCVVHHLSVQIGHIQ